LYKLDQCGKKANELRENATDVLFTSNTSATIFSQCLVAVVNITSH